MNEIIRAYGIDLGTTNSTLAIVEVPADQAQLPLAEAVEIEQPTTAGAKISAVVPSVVAVHAGRVWVGEGANGLKALAADSKKKIVRYRNLFYETKNEIGTSRTYAGDSGISTPADVAERVVRFIKEEGIGSNCEAEVVVTVPASFQMLQRQDTLLACQRAGLEVSGGRLLDEPCAAFIDYISRNSASLDDLGMDRRNLLVVDFGGGTCDVALLELTSAGEGPIQMKSLAVSRYHRLGGSDIDLAIVHKVLLPALVEENKLSEFDLDFEELQARFVPALQPVAEALKIQLSNEMWRREAFGQTSEQVAAAEARFPQMTRIPSRRLQRDLTLSPAAAVLSGKQFNDLLEPFLSKERLAPAQFEYRLECSIFSPIEDALECSGLEREDVHLLLSVGGSALFPQVDKALRDAFPHAQHLRFADRAEYQHAIARGAAVQAWSFARFGHGLIQTVAQDDILLVLDEGQLKLISSGFPLPFPAQGQEATSEEIAVPADATRRSLFVAFKFVAGRNGQTIGCGTLDVGGARKGQVILLHYSFDDNQVFRVRAKLKGVEEGPELRIAIENPVSNVVNPNSKLEERDQLVESLRRSPEKWADDIPRIAQLCAELDFHAEAISWLDRYQRKLGRQDVWATNLQGIYEADRGNTVGALKFYRLAASLPGSGGAPLFNIALRLRSEGKWKEALQSVDQAIALSPAPAYRVLRLTILEKLKQVKSVRREAQKLIDAFAPVSQLNEFALGWLATAARLAGRDDLIEEINLMRAARNLKEETTQCGLLPTLAKE